MHKNPFTTDSNPLWSPPPIAGYWKMNPLKNQGGNVYWATVEVPSEKVRRVAKRFFECDWVEKIEV